MARSLASATVRLIFYCDAAGRPAGVDMIRPSSSARRRMETGLFGVAHRQFEVRTGAGREVEPFLFVKRAEAEAWTAVLRRGSASGR